MRSGIAGAGIGLLAAAVLSACGGSGGGGGNAASASTSGSSPSSAASAAASSSGGTATTVQVTAKDYSFSLSSTSFSPGTYTFRLMNAGGTTHGLEIDGPGVEDQKAGLAGPGSSSSITVTLKAGRYELYCPVPGHRAMGMQTEISVG